MTEENITVARFQKGQVPWNKGKPHSQETRDRISQALMGRKATMLGEHHTEATKKKISLARKGKPLPLMRGENNPAKRPEVREKMSKAHTGKKASAETKAKMSKARKGKHHTEEAKAKMKKAHLGRAHPWAKGKNNWLWRRGDLIRGEQNPNWKGGLSSFPYPAEFSEELKELIRERDGHTCQLCGVPQRECFRALSIHHIDYDKQNCLPRNLISLCQRCNARVNGRRNYWTNFFQEKLELTVDFYQPGKADDD